VYSILVVDDKPELRQQLVKILTDRGYQVDEAANGLEALPRLEDEKLVFPSSKRGTPMSDMTLTAALRRMGRGDVTAHGFRSTFRDWVAESTNYPGDMAEMALAGLDDVPFGK